MSSNTPYEKYIEAQRRLASLTKIGRGGGTAAEKLREELDGLWGLLSDKERSKAQAETSKLHRGV
jgi:hypothetical protein